MRNIIPFIGIGLFLVVVFIASLVSQFAPDEPPPEQLQTESSDNITGPPLRFSTNQIYFNPTSEELSQKYFQSFYEVSEQLAKVSFWFQNPHKVPVTLTVRGRSCTSCTSAKVAIIPSNAVNQFSQQVALSRLTPSAYPMPDFITPIMGISMMNAVEWKGLDFDRPDEGVEIPAAVDAKTPTWGVFQMLIKVTGIGPKQLGAEVGMQVGSMPVVKQQFLVAVTGVPPFDVTPRSIPIGDFPEGSNSRSYELIYWSATREMSELGAPIVNVDIKDPFVVVGTPVPMTMEDRVRHVALQVSEGKTMRCTAGYKIPVTVYRRRTDPSLPSGSPTEPDIGPFERQIGVTSQGTTTVQTVSVTATVSGLVSLSDGQTVDLKDFNGRFGTDRTVNLVSDRADLELEFLKEQSKPTYIKAELAKPRMENGRRYWSLKVIVPPESCLQEIPNHSYLVFQGKSGDQTYKVRIPVKGRGFARGS